MPVAGMVLGNSLAAGVLTIRRLVEAVAERRADLEARLALGLPWQDAVRPTVRQVLRPGSRPTSSGSRRWGSSCCRAR